EGLLGRHPRRARELRGRDARRASARRRRGAGRRVHLVGLSRRGRLRRDHPRAALPPGRPLRARGTHRLIARAGLALGAVAAVTAPWWVANPYHLHVLIMAGVFTILALSLKLLLGYTGPLSLGHAAFFGIGAYTSALLSLPPLQWSFWLALPAAALASGLAGWAIGRHALSRAGGGDQRRDGRRRRQPLRALHALRVAGGLSVLVHGDDGHHGHRRRAGHAGRSRGRRAAVHRAAGGAARGDGVAVADARLRRDSDRLRILPAARNRAGGCSGDREIGSD